MSGVSRRLAATFAQDMTDGLQDAAERAQEDLERNDEMTASFASVKEDADHIQFVAHDELHSQVGDRAMTEVGVGIDDQPVPSGKDPEVVVQAFEFGSNAWNVPATSFSQGVIEKNVAESKEDVKEIEKALE